MINRDLLLSYFEVASSLNVISSIEYDLNDKVLEFKTNKTKIKVYLDLEHYKDNNKIYLHLTKYLDDDKIERIEIVKYLEKLKGNELEDFNLIIKEIVKFEILVKDYNY